MTGAYTTKNLLLLKCISVLACVHILIVRKEKFLKPLVVYAFHTQSTDLTDTISTLDTEEIMPQKTAGNGAEQRQFGDVCPRNFMA